MRGFCKSRFIRKKKRRVINYSPLSLCPFPPDGAREVIAPQSIPAPSGGRMSEGQKGAASNNLDFCKRLMIYKIYKN